MWIDSHCHLEADDYRLPDERNGQDGSGNDERPAILERARQGGVSRLIVIGSGKGRTEIDNAIAFAEKHPHLYAAIGVHPHEASGCTDELFAAIETLATKPRVVAVGETGLDYHYMLSPPEAQKALLRRFLRLSLSLRKPVSLHIRSDDKPGSTQSSAHADAQRRKLLGAAGNVVQRGHGRRS